MKQNLYFLNQNWQEFKLNFPGLFFYQRIIKLIFCLVLGCGAVCSFAEETETIDTIYAKKKDAVFLVNQSIFVDANKLEHKAFFEKLEIALNKKIINQYIPVSSGTAFLINKDGYLLTNDYFVRAVDNQVKLEEVQWSFLKYLSEHMIPGILTDSELNTVVREFYRLAKKSDVVVSVKSTNKKEYEAQVIAENNKYNLALLKIQLDDKIEPLQIETGVNYKNGDIVMTIGYPFRLYVDKFLDDFKPQLTSGTITVFRNNLWDIEHTAALNFSNSGGPLFTYQGKLIGVNLVYISGNRMFFYSIASKTVIDWLNEINKAELIQVKTGDVK